MASIAFTKNHTDHSNDNGYQFEFHCDKCQNGFRSSYVASKLGMASNVLRAASSMFGGVLSQAAGASGHLKDALRGKNHDDAFAAAVEELRPKFRQCTRCGHWICPEVCWNPKATLCKTCAPDLGEETASAQADALKNAVRTQIQAKADAADLTSKLDVSKQAAAACPHCGARVEGGKFCGSCGKPLSAKTACKGCKAELDAGARFCAQCGAPQS